MHQYFEICVRQNYVLVSRCDVILDLHIVGDLIQGIMYYWNLEDKRMLCVSCQLSIVYSLFCSSQYTLSGICAAAGKCGALLGATFLHH